MLILVTTKANFAEFLSTALSRCRNCTKGTRERGKVPKKDREVHAYAWLHTVSSRTAPHVRILARSFDGRSGARMGSAARSRARLAHFPRFSVQRASGQSRAAAAAFGDLRRAVAVVLLCAGTITAAISIENGRDVPGPPSSPRRSQTPMGHAQFERTPVDPCKGAWPAPPAITIMEPFIRLRGALEPLRTASPVAKGRTPCQDALQAICFEA